MVCCHLVRSETHDPLSMAIASLLVLIMVKPTLSQDLILLHVSTTDFIVALCLEPQSVLVHHAWYMPEPVCAAYQP